MYEACKSPKYSTIFRDHGLDSDRVGFLGGAYLKAIERKVVWLGLMVSGDPSFKKLLTRAPLAT